MRIFNNISHTCHDTISLVLRIYQCFFINNSYKTKLSSPKRRITISTPISSRYKYHILLGYKPFHYIIKMIKHLRSEEHTSELQSRFDLVCRLLLEKKKKKTKYNIKKKQ